MKEEQRDDRVLRELLVEVLKDRMLTTKVIEPIWLANQGMNEIERREGRTPPLGYIGCHNHLRQIGRDILRNWFEPDSDEERQPSIQHSLWPELQTMYPKAHKKGQTAQYVPLEDTTDADLDFNINRLRNEARAKNRHADVLRAYRDSRRGPGRSSPEPSPKDKNVH